MFAIRVYQSCTETKTLKDEECVKSAVFITVALCIIIAMLARFAMRLKQETISNKQEFFLLNADYVKNTENKK